MLESLSIKRTQNEREKKEEKERNPSLQSPPAENSETRLCTQTSCCSLVYTHDSFSLVQFGLDPIIQSQLCSLLQGAQPRPPTRQSLEAEVIPHGCLSRQMTAERPPMQNQESLDDINCVPMKQQTPRKYQIVKLAALTQAAILGGQLSLQTGFHRHSSLPQPAKPAPKRHSRQAGRQAHHNPRPRLSRRPRGGWKEQEQ